MGPFSRDYGISVSSCELEFNLPSTFDCSDLVATVSTITLKYCGRGLVYILYMCLWMGMHVYGRGCMNEKYCTFVSDKLLLFMYLG